MATFHNCTFIITTDALKTMSQAFQDQQDQQQQQTQEKQELLPNEESMKKKVLIKLIPTTLPEDSLRTLLGTIAKVEHIDFLYDKRVWRPYRVVCTCPNAAEAEKLMGNEIYVADVQLQKKILEDV